MRKKRATLKRKITPPAIRVPNSVGPVPLVAPRLVVTLVVLEFEVWDAKPRNPIWKRKSELADWSGDYRFPQQA